MQRTAESISEANALVQQSTLYGEFVAARRAVYFVPEETRVDEVEATYARYNRAFEELTAACKQAGASRAAVFSRAVQEAHRDAD